MPYDIIGDIHGHASALETLLTQLGYHFAHGRWGHPERQALFVGDFIDRGPEQIETLKIVRAMIDAGTARAVQGNHEMNAIGFATRDSQGYLRVRGSKNIHQHRAFLEAVGLDSDLHKEWVQWFRTLPLWLELPELRLVHACWSDMAISNLRSVLGETALFPDELTPFYRKGHDECVATEILLKGLEMALPDDVVFLDKDGVTRKNTRVKWWDSEATTLRRAAVDNVFSETLQDDPLPEGISLGYHGKKPVFVGHYWMQGRPFLLSDRVACVDFSVAKGGVLCAYSFDGEGILSADKLSWTPPTPEMTLAP